MNDLAPYAGNRIDTATAGWLHTAANRTGSAKTMRAYTAAITSFRALLQGHGLDLESDAQAVALLAQA